MVIKKTAFFILLIFSLNICFAAETTAGFLRLILDEKTGGFSLFYLTNPRSRVYEPLFYTEDTSTSFLSVMVDDTVYKPGSSRYFIKRIETPHGQPSIVYESSFVLIRQIFSPVKTPGSNNINGVQITVTIQNKKNKMSFIGLRYLLDTTLGEARGKVPFITKNQIIRRETTIEGDSSELFWISQGNNASLMGSIANPIDTNARRPDYVQFANWKRLNDAEWDLEGKEGRSFNYMPYSIGDSAVCYFYLPKAVEAGETLSFSIVLTTADIDWYNKLQTPASAKTSAQTSPVPAPVPAPAPAQEVPVVIPVPDDFFEIEPIIEPELFVEPEPAYKPEPVYNMPENYEVETQIEYPHLNTAQLRELYALQELLNDFIEGKIDLLEEDLAEIGITIDKLKTGK